MSVITITAIRCDHCRAEYRGYTGTYANGLSAREAARGHGWVTKRAPDGRLMDLCPHCLRTSPTLSKLPDAQPARS